MSYIDPSKKQEFADLQTQAKKLAADGKLVESLIKFEEAKKICPTPKVLQRIETLKAFMKSTGLVTESCYLKSETNNSEEVKHVEDYSDAEKINYLSSSVSDLPKGSHSAHITSTNLIRKTNTCIPASKSEMKHFSDAEKFNNSSKAVKKSPEKSTSEFDDSEKERKLSEVKLLYEEARTLASSGKLTESLEVLLKAQSIYETERVQKKIIQIREFIENDTESNDRINIAEDFSLYHKIYKSLYPYQRDGVAWLWGLYKKHKGGILADDMGLGKTFQVIAFLSGMIDADIVKHVLIVMPVSLLTNWDNEFKKWCPGIAVHDFHGSSKKLRERNLLRVQKRGHVLLTTYGMILNNVDVLSRMDDREFVWDYLILDEGHKIKNASKTTKAVHDIPSRHRIVLTGTPIQNNLKELWSLFDFVHQGTLLGSLKTFKNQYENPIIRSREKGATSGEKRLGAVMSDNLKELINPYFIRRTKKEIWGENGNKAVTELENQMNALSLSMPKKNDFILWTFMSEAQIEIYKSFLHSNAVKEILMSKRSPLVELTVLKKICDHPRLLSRRACLQLGLGDELLNEDLLDDESSSAPSIDGVSDEMLLLESGKLKLVVSLIEHLKEFGHRTLFFSLSRKILDMMQRILINRKYKVMRIDGTISKTEERERRIQKFQRDASYSVFLLTTQVGGVGINLTAADRVIIYDPSWNPATDAQAVDRVFRIGQNKNVVIYRLITCGSVEEKIYRRQIFKDSITRQTTSDTDPHRYFSHQELRELFSLEDPQYSATQVQLHNMHSAQRKTDDTLTRHIEFLKTLNIFGISDHDLMFTKEVQDNVEDNDEKAISDNFIRQKVAAANDLIKKEASVIAEGLRVAGTFNRPYQLPVPTPRKLKVKELYKPPSFPEIDLTDSSENKNLAGIKLSLEKRNSSDVEIIDLDSNGDCYNEEIEKRTSEWEKELKISFLNEDCREIARNSQLDETCIKSGRLSCARQSGVFSPEKYDTSSEMEDSSNSASLSFVPDSASNTPQKLKNKTTCYPFISETPPSVPELFAGNTSEADIFVKKHEDNVRRITPLKVNKSLTQEDSSFAQALASSVIITPKSSPKEIQNISVQRIQDQSLVSEDSPIHFNRRRVRQIVSDSEESDDEDKIIANLSHSSKIDAPLVQVMSSSVTTTPISSLQENRHKLGKGQSSRMNDSPNLSSRGKMGQIASDSEVSEDETTTIPKLPKSCKESTLVRTVPSSVINVSNASPKERKYEHGKKLSLILNESPSLSGRGKVKEIPSDSEDSDSEVSEDESKMISKLSKSFKENTPVQTGMSSVINASSAKESQYERVKKRNFIMNDDNPFLSGRGKEREIPSYSEDSDSDVSEDEDKTTSKLSKSFKENTPVRTMASSVTGASSPKESQYKPVKNRHFILNDDNPFQSGRGKVREIPSEPEDSDSDESDDENKMISNLSKSSKKDDSFLQAVPSSPAASIHKGNHQVIKEQSSVFNESAIQPRRSDVKQIACDPELHSDSEESHDDSGESDTDSEESVKEQSSIFNESSAQFRREVKQIASDPEELRDDSEESDDDSEESDVDSEKSDDDSEVSEDKGEVSKLSVKESHLDAQDDSEDDEQWSDTSGSLFSEDSEKDN